MGSSLPSRIKPASPALAARFFTAEPPGKPQGYNVVCCVCAVLNCMGYVQLFETLWTVAARLFCSWDSPGKNTGAGCHALLTGIFLTQGSNLCHLLMSPALAGGFFTTSTPWEAPCLISNNLPFFIECTFMSQIKDLANYYKTSLYD